MTSQEGTSEWNFWRESRRKSASDEHLPESHPADPRHLRDGQSPGCVWGSRSLTASYTAFQLTHPSLPLQSEIPDIPNSPSRGSERHSVFALAFPISSIGLSFFKSVQFNDPLSISFPDSKSFGPCSFPILLLRVINATWTGLQGQKPIFKTPPLRGIPFFLQLFTSPAGLVSNTELFPKITEIVLLIWQKNWR